MRLVAIESPYAGHSDWIWPFHAIGKWLDRRRNVRYARECLSDSIHRGEAPIASHLLYTQSGVLDDTIPEERQRGMRAGFVWAALAELRVFYVDLGVSAGMAEAREEAARLGQPVEFRSIFAGTGYVLDMKIPRRREPARDPNPH